MKHPDAPQPTPDWAPTPHACECFTLAPDARSRVVNTCGCDVPPNIELGSE